MFNFIFLCFLVIAAPNESNVTTWDTWTGNNCNWTDDNGGMIVAIDKQGYEKVVKYLRDEKLPNYKQEYFYVALFAGQRNYIKPTIRGISAYKRRGNVIEIGSWVIDPDVSQKIKPGKSSAWILLAIPRKDFDEITEKTVFRVEELREQRRYYTARPLK